MEHQCVPPGLIRNKGFLVLTTVQWLSQYGEFTFLITAVWAATMRTSSPLFVSMVFMLNLIPGLVISPLAGMVVDRMDRRAIVLLSSGVRSLLLFILVFAARGDSYGLGLVLAATLIMSVFARAFSAAHFALLPALVHESDLQTANSVSSFTMNAAYAAGTFLSALLMARLGWAAAVTLSAGLFTASTALTFILGATPAVSAPRRDSLLTETARSLRSGLNIVGSILPVRVCMLLAAVASLVCGTISLLPVYIKETLGESVIQYGLVEGLSVVGAVLASLILARVAVKRPYPVMFAAVAAVACAVWWFGSGLHVATLVLARMTLALALGVFNILFVTEFHRLLPSEYRGRVFSLSYVVSTVPYMLSMACAGAAAEFVPFWVVWATAGGAGLLGVCLCYGLLRRAPASGWNPVEAADTGNRQS